MNTIERFWIEKTDFPDLNEGWAHWTDGTEGYEIDVLKDPERITPLQYEWLVKILEKVMIGANRNQFAFIYFGVLDEVRNVDDVDLDQVYGDLFEEDL